MRMRYRGWMQSVMAMLLVLCCCTLEILAQQTGGKKQSADEQSLGDSVRQMQQQIQ